MYCVLQLQEENVLKSLTPTFCQALKQRKYLVITCVHVCGGMCVWGQLNKKYIFQQKLYFTSLKC